MKKVTKEHKGQQENELKEYLMPAYRISKLSLSLVFGLLVFSPAVVTSQTRVPAPERVVQSFYQYHFAHDRSFRKGNVTRRRQWLTPTLFDLLMNEFSREAEYAKDHPHESFVPYMEGDPFTDSSEFPTSFRVGHAFVNRTSAVVSVVMLWSARSSRGHDQRNLEVHLVPVNGRWLINDVVNKDDDDDLVVDLKREKYLP